MRVKWLDYMGTLDLRVNAWRLDDAQQKIDAFRWDLAYLSQRIPPFDVKVARHERTFGSRSEPKVSRMVDQNRASWNPLISWLRQIDQLWRAA